jgi:hypothetical protein
VQFAREALKMKRLFLLAILVSGFVLIWGVPAFGQNCSGAATLKTHIYNPDRLVPTEKGCITVTGKIIAKVPEKDGDYHYRMKLDPGQGSGLINSKNNTKKQKRFFIFEPICIGKVTQKTAKRACRGFHQQITLPNKGDRVSVTGLHMLDEEHGWLEIHPVTKITVLR